MVDQLARNFRQEEWAMLVQRQRLQRTTTECRLQWVNAMAPTLRCGAVLWVAAVSGVQLLLPPGEGDKQLVNFNSPATSLALPAPSDVLQPASMDG